MKTSRINFPEVPVADGPAGDTAVHRQTLAPEIRLVARGAILTRWQNGRILGRMRSHFRTFSFAMVMSGLCFLTACGGDDNAEAAIPVVDVIADTSNIAATNSEAEASANNEANTETNQIVAVVPPKTPDDVKISSAVDQIIKMAQSGLGDSVLLAYIQTSVASFDLDADEILYLTDIGLSDEVLAAMLSHDGESKDLINQAKAQTPAPPAAATGETTPGAAQAPVGYSSVPVNPAPGFAEAVQEPPQVYTQPPEIQTVAEPVVTYDTFYTSLSPYGTWVDVPAYGWCWEPTVATIDPGWRPYSQRGRWLDSDCGWYWQSDYSWGWAPFHYGRWYQPAGRGWCWVPGRTWGPSWVSWRQSVGYCGWAPLPPGAHFRPGFGFSFHNSHVGAGFGFGLGYNAYTFVPTGHFYDREPYRHAISRSQSTPIYNRSTVVNNYTTSNNNSVVNNGIPASHIAAAMHTEIRKVSVRDLPAGTTAIRPDRLRKQGGDLVVYRPMPAEVTRPGALRPQTGRNIGMSQAAISNGRAEARSERGSEIGRSRPVIPNTSNLRSVSPREAALEQSTPAMRPAAPSRGLEPIRNRTVSPGLASQAQTARSEPDRASRPPQYAGTGSRSLATTTEFNHVIGSITDQSGQPRAIESRPTPESRFAQQNRSLPPSVNSNPQVSRGNSTWTANSAPAVTPNYRTVQPSRGSGVPSAEVPTRSRPAPAIATQNPAAFGRPEFSRAPEAVAIAPREEAPRYASSIQSRPIQSAQSAPAFQPRSIPSAPTYTPPPVNIRPNFESRSYAPPPPQYSAPQPSVRAPAPAPAPHPVYSRPAPPSAPQGNGRAFQGRGRQIQ